MYTLISFKNILQHGHLDSISQTNGGHIGLAVALIIVAVFTRLFALKAQDRVIRLEEQLRIQALLPDALKTDAGRLTMGQIVALRFASDEELAELTQDALDHNTSPNALKQAVKNWRPDYNRV